MFLENTKKGSIEVICGSMFSGKTEELIRRVKRVRFAKQKFQIFKPLIDTRYSEENVVSHDSNAVQSKAISDPKIMLEVADDIKVIAIDEAQFFDFGIVEVVETLAARGKRIIIAGLDMDFLAKPFGPMPKLMAIADHVLKVHAICVKCGDLASHSHRLLKDNNLVLLGEKNEYEPLCRSCYYQAIKG